MTNTREMEPGEEGQTVRGEDNTSDEESKHHGPGT